jgi:hypothetical protein
MSYACNSQMLRLLAFEASVFKRVFLLLITTNDSQKMFSFFVRTTEWAVREVPA